jgi:hypothetical protein
VVGVMPKESVRDKSVVGKLAMVGWSDGSVQLGAVDSNVELTPTLEYDEKGSPQDPSSTDSTNSVWVDLDRSGINDLIKILRKARDRAYGPDA